MLYFFKDNEAVIQMIIKGRSPTIVKTTPQKTRFRDVKYARIWDTD